jgi:hypothetical protein
MTSACIEVTAGDALRYVDRVEKRSPVTAKPEVTLTTFDGSIEIRPWDRSEVLVVVEKRAATKAAADDIDVQAEQDGNRVTVSTRVHRSPVVGIWLHGSRRARLMVSIPASTDVHARSGDGSVDIEGISGRLEMRTGDGGIRGRHLSGTLSMHTGDGSIRLNEVDGRLDAVSGDGSIVVDGRLTGVRVRTGDGSVSVSASDGSAASDAWNVVTGDGSVTMEFPDGFSGELDAHTGDGSIVMRDITLSNVTGRFGRSNVRGRLGSGGQPIQIRTGDGSITLRRR